MKCQRTQLICVQSVYAADSGELLQAQTDALQGLKDGKGGVGAIDTDNALKKQKALEEEIAKTNEEHQCT